MPRLSSTVIENAQTFVPARFSQPLSGPRLVYDFSGARYGVELPESSARDRIERARVSGRPERNLVHAGADHDDVLIDGRRSPVADNHVNFAVGTKILRRIFPTQRPTTAGDGRRW